MNTPQPLAAAPGSTTTLTPAHELLKRRGASSPMAGLPSPPESVESAPEGQKAVFLAFAELDGHQIAEQYYSLRALNFYPAHSQDQQLGALDLVRGLIGDFSFELKGFGLQALFNGLLQQNVQRIRALDPKFPYAAETSAPRVVQLIMRPIETQPDPEKL